MRSLWRSPWRRDAGGAPLPTVFPSLARRKADIRKAELTLLAGQPGAGKSTVALWCAVQWVTQHNLIGLYLSADSSELVMASRTAAMVLGEPFTDMELALKTHDHLATLALQRVKGLDFSFEPDISLEVLSLELDAFVEKWGRAPDFVVVDNLTDVEGQDPDEFSSLRRVMKTLTYAARKTGAAVLILHHTSEAGKLEPCPARKDIHGKVSQKAALVLTCAEGEGTKPIAVVKNRFGWSDRSGRTVDWIKFDAERMTFLDIA